MSRYNPFWEEAENLGLIETAYHEGYDEGWAAGHEDWNHNSEEIRKLETIIGQYEDLLSARKRVEGPSLEREIDEFYKKREETSQPL